MYFNFLLSVPPPPHPTPLYRHQCCLFLLSLLIASVCQIYFSSFFQPLFFPLLFSLKSLTGCTKLIDIKAAGHLPLWFFLLLQKKNKNEKGKTVSSSDSYSDLAFHKYSV